MTTREFIIGAGMIAVGLHMVMKTDDYIAFIGLNNWAEAKWGGGGTRLLYKLIGTLICFFGILGVTGQLTSAVGGAVGSVFGSHVAQ